MPKKFKGENSKAAEARAKKEEKKVEENEKKEREKEDEFWKDDDKHVMRKLQRKDDKDKKRTEQLERKKELQRLHDEEQAQIKTVKPQAAAKITRAQIETQEEQRRTEAAAAEVKEKSLMHDEVPLEENVNRLIPEGDEARSVDEAISVLSVQELPVDRHPERREKAAYKKYEEENLPLLKEEYPSMRLAQLKHMLQKDWKKSPENPLMQLQASAM